MPLVWQPLAWMPSGQRSLADDVRGDAEDAQAHRRATLATVIVFVVTARPCGSAWRSRNSATAPARSRLRVVFFVDHFGGWV
jgi:hypothetical protein